MPFASRGFVVLCAAAVAFCAAPGARAQRRPTVAVLDLVIEGDAVPELREQLDKSLAGGLYAAGYQVIRRDEVLAKLQRAPELIGCVTTTCLERLSPLLGARQFVRARIEVQGAAYTIELELLSPRVPGGVVKRVERTCAVCTIGEANDAMSRAAAELEHQAAETRVVVAIATNPPGATIMVDDEVKGRAPLEIPLSPGQHRIRASKDGTHAPETKVIEVQPPPDGGVIPLHIDLVPVEPPKPTSRFGVWKWVGAGVSAATVVTGVTLMAIHHNETDFVDPPAGGEPIGRRRYDTLAAGIVTTAVGAAIGAATIWMILEDRPRDLAPGDDRPSAWIAPTVEGGVYGAVTIPF